MHGNPTRRRPRDSALPRLPLHRAGALLGAWFAALERARQRRALAQLSDFMLKDIGLTRAEAEAESAKSPWRR